MLAEAQGNRRVAFVPPSPSELAWMRLRTDGPLALHEAEVDGDDALMARLHEADLARLARDEAPRLLGAVRWLSRRRGRLVERFIMLASEGRLSADELADVLGDAGWNADDAALLRERAQRMRQAKQRGRVLRRGGAG